MSEFLKNPQITNFDVWFTVHLSIQYSFSLEYPVRVLGLQKDLEVSI